METVALKPGKASLCPSARAEQRHRVVWNSYESVRGGCPQRFTPCGAGLSVNRPKLITAGKLWKKTSRKGRVMCQGAATEEIRSPLERQFVTVWSDMHANMSTSAQDRTYYIHDCNSACFTECMFLSYVTAVQWKCIHETSAIKKGTQSACTGRQSNWPSV